MDHWCYYSFLLTTCLWKFCIVHSLNFYMKDFMQSQGRRLKFQLKQYGSLESIFSDLSMPFNNGNVGSSSVVASDIVSVGDSWLSYAIRKSIIQPIEGVEDQEWFKGLSTKWKVSIQLFFFFFRNVLNWSFFYFLTDGSSAYLQPMEFNVKFIVLTM